MEGRFLHLWRKKVKYFTDREYSKAYLRHLFVSKEILAAMIATIHNLGFYMWLMRTARKKIVEGTFSGWKNSHGKTTDE